MSFDPDIVILGMASKVEPVAARYLSESRELEIEFNTGMHCRWPVDNLQLTRSFNGQVLDLEPRPTDEQLSDVMLWSSGEVVEFTAIGQGFEVAALMRGELGSKRWIDRLLGNESSLYLVESVGTV